MKKYDDGITVITLTVTIIILLILASITILSLTGKGPFDSAKEAKKQLETEQNKADGILNKYDEKLEKYRNNSTSENNTVDNNEVGGGDIDEEEKFKNVDTDITDPGAALPDNVTIIENDVEKGIVISDYNENEWVWIPVPKTIYTTATSDEDYENILADMITYSGKMDFKDQYGTNIGIDSEKQYADMYHKMLTSVYRNGGFWISRYEIGNESATLKSNGVTNVVGAKAVSKINQIPYNGVTCIGAQLIASGLRPQYDRYTSSLLFGIQWNLVCQYLKEHCDNTVSGVIRKLGEL